MRPRKHNKHLPPCVYIKHGAYYYVKAGRWHPLGRDLREALLTYARLASASTSGITLCASRSTKSTDYSRQGYKNERAHF